MDIGVTKFQCYYGIQNNMSSFSCLHFHQVCNDAQIVIHSNIQMNNMCTNHDLKIEQTKHFICTVKTI
jgi:hypothetical protein